MPGRNPRGDVGFADIEVRDGDDTLGGATADGVGDVGELGVCLRETAAVVDKQDRPFHFASAARFSAWARSSHKSSACSMPTESLTVASLMPLLSFSAGAKAPWLIVHG